jgi:hypothetical protein
LVPQVFVGGVPVASLAPVGDLVISHEWPAAGVGGPVSAQFSLLLGPRERPGWLARGATAVVRAGGVPVLAGTVAEVDFTDGRVSIDGAAREGVTTACITAGTVPTSTPDVALDAAIGRGALTWTRPASIGAVPLTEGDVTEQINTVADMLAQVADETGQRIYVDPWRRVMKAPDPVTPVFFLMPGAGELSWVSEDQATRVFGAWYDAYGTLQTTSAGAGGVERLIDLTEAGDGMDSNRAATILANVLSRSSAGGWAGGITVTQGHIAGWPSLATVANTVGRGAMVRLPGRDPRPGRLPAGCVDVVVERSEWRVQDGTITLTPRGMAARDFVALLAEFGAREA